MVTEVSVHENEKWYHVKYQDSDSEDMDEQEFQKASKLYIDEGIMVDDDDYV